MNVLTVAVRNERYNFRSVEVLRIGDFRDAVIPLGKNHDK